MKNEKWGWQILTLVVALASIVVPVYVSYDNASRGSAPEKRLELLNQVVTYPLEDLNPDSGSAIVSIQVNNTTYTNVAIILATIKNAGNAPIVPSDFVEPLSISVPAPWKIIEVKPTARWFSPLIKPVWKRINDQSFVADPTLLNPGDEIYTTVYATNPTLTHDPQPGSQAPKLSWQTRIINLKTIEEVPNIFERNKGNAWGIFVSLSGWSTVFVLVAYVAFQAIYIALFHSLGWTRKSVHQSIVLVVGSGLLSLSAAEAMATYMFSSTLYELMGVSNLLNAPPIIANAAAIITLLVLKRSRPQSSRILMP